jgi:thiosulfate/3-mercaptopyruvate sulfurtransferase
MYTTLISTSELQELLHSGAPCMVFDCSFDLVQPDAGIQMFEASHLSGAVYANLNIDLSAKGDRLRTGAESGGRHPLPSRENFAKWLGQMGFGNDMQAVVYDRQGASYCGRLWWMLKWLGHERVAVLDGGLQAWQASGGSVVPGPNQTLPHTKFSIAEPLVALVSAETVLGNLGKTDQTVIDARAAPRFRGEIEPLDPVAGHIPGALNRPFTNNLTAEGFFKSKDVLRHEFEELLGARRPEHTVHHCGSGVTAIPNILAMAIAGLGNTALFAGSWSEWCSDPHRPVAKG